MDEMLRTTEANDLFLLSCRAKNLSHWSITDYKKGCTNFIRAMGDMDVLDIDKRVVRQYADARFKLGLSPYTVHRELRWLRALLNFLYYEELIPK